MTAVATAHAHGMEVDWEAVFAGTGARRIDLPTYAFQHKWYWLEPTDAPVETGGFDAEFWAAVERADLDELAATLDVDDATLAAVVPALSAWRKRRHEESALDQWRYRITWHSAPEPGAARLLGRWLLLAPSGGHELVSVLSGVLSEHGAEVVAAEPDTMPDTDGYAGIVSLLGLDESPHPDAPVVPSGLAHTAQLVKDAAAPVWLLTRGAVSVGGSDPLTNPVQAQVWGLGRVAALEHADRWGGLLDLPERIDARAAHRIAAALAGIGHEDQLAIRESGVYLRRLEHGAGERGTTGWSPRGTVLVTGGTGALGSRVAAWLRENGAEHVVLTSRRGADAEGAAELAAELGATVAACDVADRDSLDALVRRCEEAGTPVRAVVHCAGAVEPDAEPDTNLAELRTLLSAKVGGADALVDVFAERELDAFVLFSSVAGVWGSGGQAAYSAANAYLDALAEQRRQAGLPATSVAWGPWAEAGMAASDAGREQLSRRGMPAIAPATALTALGHALQRGEALAVVADIDWDRFVPGFTLARPRPLIEDLPEVRRLLADEPAAAATEAGALQTLLAGLPEAEHRSAVVECVCDAVAAVLGFDSGEDIEPQRAFTDLGFDSLTAVEFRNRLAESTGLRLPATLVFDYPTPVVLAEHLLSEVAGTVGGGDTPVTVVADPDEPIAIVGMSCRFPGGVNTPDDLWRLVATGADGISPFPGDRGWDVTGIYHPDPDHQGTTYAREGGFLHDAGEFDAAFFGISPREALAMDPQQRLLLEASWEAIERAGIDPHSLRGSDSGVFAGATFTGYGAGAAGSAEGYSLAGGSPSVVSGRVSYVLGLEGPALTVDTACSSSLVALHLAAQSLRRGECSLALAGGVMVMPTPTVFVEFSRQRGLAPDGRCKPFAAAADGTGWSEGVGVLVVERLSDAVARGHRVLAVVRGSAVNQDGASNGLTAPNGPSQQRVIRAALANAGLRPRDVDVVEAHGTGTRLGDPIEAQALLATYGQERDEPLWLGSVKSNIGHTQAAAGVAGVMKMVLAMRHGVVPKTLHVDEPTPEVDWSAGAVSVATEATPWPETGRPRRAGVSSFGISGTNAHIILEQAPEPAALPERAAELPAVPWVLSGRTESALRAQAARLRAAVEADPSADAGDIGFSLATTRSAFEHRAVVVGSDRDELLLGVKALAAGETTTGLVRDVASSGGRTAVLFSGQGSQHAGMGRQLYAAYPVFAEALDAVCAEFAAELDVPLRDVLFDRDSELVHQTRYTQPALFAFEVALYRLARSWGLRPDYVLGHSLGEITAAHVSGALSLPDACRLVAARARLMGELPQAGVMVAVQATEDEIAPMLDTRVSVAAVNGPRSVVVSGDTDAVERIAAHWRDLGRKTKRVRTSIAAHSPHMEPMLEAFRAVVDTITPAEPEIPIVSNLGTVLDSAQHLNADHWVRHVREAVRFADSIRWLEDHQVNRFVELGPEPVLSALVEDCLAEGGRPVLAVPALRADQPEPVALVTAFGRLHAHGAELDWHGMFDGTGARTVELPAYAFQHERFWLDTVEPAAVDTEFWTAVENGDVEQLSDALGVDGQALSAVVPALSAWHRGRATRSRLDAWRYEIGWSPLPEPATPLLTGRWVVVGSDNGDDGMVAALASHGADVVRAEPGTLGELGPVDGIVSLLALDDTPKPEHPAVSRGLADTLRLLQERIDAPLWTVTRGAVTTGGSDPVRNPAQACVWGLGRAAALEHPDRWGGLIDLPEVLDERATARLVSVLASGREDQVAIRESGLFGRRLQHAAPDPAEPWQPRGTVLMTGGSGIAGREVARWLAENGAEHLALLNADAPAELDASTSTHTVDATDRRALAAVLDTLAAEGRPVRAVVHADGLNRQCPIAELTVAGLAEALAAKSVPAHHLAELLAGADLDAFVLFSSVAGTWGSSGQAAYGAANAYLDALAAQQASVGLAATSVSWGPWAEGTPAEDELRTQGLPAMPPESAIAALGKAAAGTRAELVVADVDWTTFAPRFGSVRPSPLLDALPEARAALAEQEAQAEPATSAHDLVARLRTLDGTARTALLLEVVCAAVADVLGHASAEAIDATGAFADLGFDSLTAVELRNRLAAETGCRLPATLVFDYPTPEALAGHLRSALLPEPAGGEDTPLLSDVDRIRAKLTGTGVDGQTRAEVAERLRELLALCEDDGGQAADEPARGDVEAISSPEELFAFIDEQL
ncbi:type I polyketide synthase [Saccharomonospora azurea]|uniref:type I polyketide synthase n=1 Tax=Saccharomonospora azurea TaxID=40988 RepID=UPI0024095562|nr:type I polyketide synthase [Saccharomonospora azurea]